MEQINKKELHIIFEKMQNKDKNAFNELYKKYYKLVEKIAYSILKNKDESEDVAQNVFAKIYEMPTQNLPTTCESSWLYTVTKNETITHLKKNKNHVNIEEIYDISSEDEEINTIIEKETYNKLIQKLKPIEKEIVSLKIISQMNFRQISLVLNMPLSTVQWHYYKAIKSLKFLISNLSLLLITILLYTTKLLKITKKKSAIANDTNEQNNQTNFENNSEVNSNTEKQEQNKNEANSYFENLHQNNVNIYENTQQNIIQTEHNITINQNQEKNQSTFLLMLSSIFLLLSIFVTIIFTKYQQKICKKKS